MVFDAEGNILEPPDFKSPTFAFDRRRPAAFWSRHPEGVYRPMRRERFAYRALVLGEDFMDHAAPWLLIRFQSYRGITIALWKGVLIAGSTVLPLMGFALLMVYSTSRCLARPLLQASSAAQRVSAGDFSATLPEEGAMEMRHWATAFNALVFKIRQRHTHLEHLVEQISAHFRTAYESITNGLLIVEWPSGRLLTANHRFAELLDLPVQGLSGHTLDTLEPRILGKLAAGTKEAFHIPRYRQSPTDVVVEEWEIVFSRRQTLSVYSVPPVVRRARFSPASGCFAI